MRKILIAARDLKIGGIEKSLITLIDYLVEHGYIVTLVLEKIEGELLKNLNSNVKVIQYMPCSMAFMPIRKCINFLKRIQFGLEYKEKFDVSISYATYSKSSSYVARKASKKSILWCHADYLVLFKGDKLKVHQFFEDIRYKEFSKIVFVAKSAKESFFTLFPSQKNVYFCNNLINAQEIYQKAEKQIDLPINSKVPIFLNVGRHDESQKKLTRIIEAAKILKQRKYNFRVIFVGCGQDSKKYKSLTQKYNLEQNIIFVGEKENPYPYFKISDCIVLSSDYEGYPVVFLESYVLNKPIITTKVSDYKDIENGRGMVVEKSTNGIYKAMKEFLENGYKVKNKFDYKKYNQEIEQNLKEILKNS